MAMIVRAHYYEQFDADYTLTLPTEREPRVAEYIFETIHGPVLLRGRIDARERDPWRTVVDYKLSESFEAERYARSMQWRAYALLEHAQRFKYLVFESKMDMVQDDPERFMDVWIHDVHELVLWPYPEMEQEVKNVVSDLAGFVVKYVPGLVR